jgi:hypothetical protein
MTHFIQYIHRRVLLPTQSSRESRKFATPEPDDPPFTTPTRHVLPNQTIIRSIRDGDTVWLISQMSLRRANKTLWLPIALDARINVNASPTLEGTNWVTAAAEGSRWFPLADARCVFDELQSIGNRGAIASLATGKKIAVGRNFQSMRRLENADALLRWADRLAGTEVEFISYRQIDGTAAAFDFVSLRLAAGSTLFWDKWSLPRRLCERREEVSSRPLDETILGALDKAICVWGLESPLYHEVGRYAEKEAARARARGVFTLVP